MRPDCKLLRILVICVLYTFSRAAFSEVPLDQDPEYRSGRRYVTSGILLGSIGGGVGLVIGLMGTLEGCHTAESNGEETTHCSSNPIQQAGFGLAAVSVGVGTYLFIHGSLKKRHAREALENESHKISEISLSLGALALNTPAVGLNWRF